MSQEYRIDIGVAEISATETILELRVGPFRVRPLVTPPGQEGPWLWLCKEDGEGMGVRVEKLLAAFGPLAVACAVKDLQHFWDEEF